MARDGAGNHSLPFPDFVAGATILSSDMDTNNADISAALTQSLAKDGQTVPTANLPMGGFRHTNTSAAGQAADYARAAEVQSGVYIWPTVGGTGDVITLTTTFAPGAYAAGQSLRIKVAAGNTGAVTVNWNGLGAKAVVSSSGAALTNAALAIGDIVDVTYDGTNFRMPKDIGAAGAGTVTSVATGTGLAGGPITTTGTVSLANTAVAPNTYGSATQSAVIIIDQQGRITSASNAAISAGTGTVTNVATGTGLTGGPITTTGTVTLANTAVSPGSYGSSSQIPVITIDQQGRITAANTQAAASAYDPTGTSVIPYKIRLPINAAAANLQINGNLETITVSSGLAVTFATAFSAYPIVTATYVGTLAYVATVQAVTTTGFTLKVYNSSGTAQASVDAHWTAIGRVA